MLSPLLQTRQLQRGGAGPRLNLNEPMGGLPLLLRSSSILLDSEAGFRHCAREVRPSARFLNAKRLRVNGNPVNLSGTTTICWDSALFEALEDNSSGCDANSSTYHCIWMHLGAFGTLSGRRGGVDESGDWTLRRHASHNCKRSRGATSRISPKGLLR